MLFYKFAKTLVWFVLKPIYRMQVIGKENIPKSGPLIVCSNHISNFDPPIVGGSCPRDLHFLAKEELFQKRLLRLLMNSLGAVPIKRGMKDRNALRTVLKILEDGKALGLFPEGTRSKTGEIGEGLSGIGFFALRSNANVVPCAIIGPYQKGKRLKIVYGKPVDMEQLRNEKASAKEATDKIMNEIKKLKQNNL
ncbi:1-acyl-sn-glycerol-3-phosphate acyltransferase [Natronobacillus azotifigens]|uniref:Lysophospholipid acyltransferase family protein n=1 Tax=Natronobacillus azotifigens TaxID=472978 RepID=A0A9J6R872_9BACI|nr:lysophospholipid acyltransferase family protein [Natronobacillus azotifigens]MCZ0701848.1 lysophospholipid acyltransferase family protein [Natronobacillus azotifigens]